MTLTETQRATYLATLEANPKLGDVPALRAAGVQGTSGELRAIVRDDPELHEDAWVARGWEVLPAISALATVAVDTDHRSWNQANDRWLELRGYTKKSRLELSGPDGGPMEVDGVADALERFATLTTAAVRAAARAPAGDAPQDA